MQFVAEIKKTQQLKRVSLDNEYQLVLITDNPDILDLGKLPSDLTVKVTIETNGEHSPTEEGTL